MTTMAKRSKPAVLYVDDDRENLEGFQAVFRRDYRVYPAESASEALGILEQTDIQVLITDQRMPEMSGSDLLQQLAHRYPNMLRFILTGFSDFDPLVNAINNGHLQGYFAKPLDVDQVKNRIEEGLTKYYLKIQNRQLIASLQKSENQIRSQLAELEQVYGTAPVGLILVDRDLRIIRINEKLADIDGLSVADHIGKTLTDVVPQLADRLCSIYNAVMESGKPIVNIEIHGETPKQPGVMRDWLGSYYPFRDNNGKIVGVIGGVIEVTDLKKTEKEANEARQFTADLLQTANVLIVGLDPDGNVQIVNPAVTEKTGYTSKELKEGNWFGVVTPPKQYPKIWEDLDQFNQEALPAEFESPVCTKDGDELVISWSKSKLVRDNRTMGTLLVGDDITRRRLAEKERARLRGQLQEAQKMESIGTLAGGVAHDFNNILSPIIGFAEIIKSQVDGETPYSDYAEEILKAGLRARDLVTQILTFSRHREQDQKPIVIHLVIKEALKLLRASLPSTIVLNQRIREECGPVKGNPTQIYQVVMNLCTNAYQALQDKNGRIEVVLEEVVLTTEDQPQFLELEPGPFVRLSVSDTGPGIDPEIVDRIFDPYFTTKRMKSGTGLGLSVVHGIVKGHAGAIKVYSEAGEGTVFSIYLPRLMDDKVERAVQSLAKIPGGHDSVLLVDDEPALVQVVQTMLENLGYRVSGFTDSREALTHFKGAPHNYDLVITDMTMPHLTGLQLSQAILAAEPRMPIIICTGFNELINRRKADDIGVRHIIMKPILTHEIATTIRLVLDDN